MDSLQEAAAAGAVPLNGSLVMPGILDHDINQNPQERYRVCAEGEGALGCFGPKCYKFTGDPEEPDSDDVFGDCVCAKYGECSDQEVREIHRRAGACVGCGGFPTALSAERKLILTACRARLQRDRLLGRSNQVHRLSPNQNPQESPFFDEVIKFTDMLRASARAQSKTLVEHVWTQFGEGQDLGALREKMLLKIPYADEKQPFQYYSCSQVPNATRTTGRAHVTFLSFNPASYHSRGQFASIDVFEQLQILKQSSLGDTVDVTPARSGDMMTFGWAIDGTVMWHSTLAFAMTLMALFCVESDTTPPRHINSFLKNIRVEMQKHAFSFAEFLKRARPDTADTARLLDSRKRNCTRRRAADGTQDRREYEAAFLDEAVWTAANATVGPIGDSLPKAARR